MAFTKTILQRSPSRATVKIISDATADVSVITLKSGVTLGATGVLNFTKTTGQPIAFIGYSSGTTLYVSATNGNSLIVGSVLSTSGGFTAGTVVTAIGTFAGGYQSYTISISQSVGSAGVGQVTGSTIANGGLIQRASGSWVTDFGTAANYAGNANNINGNMLATNGLASASGTATSVLGQICVSITAGPTNAGNIRHYSIIGYAQTSAANDTILVSQLTPVPVSEASVTPTINAYYSDLLCSGQTITGTPTANINNVWISTLTGANSLIKRNGVTVIGLYGGGGEYTDKPPCAPITDNNSFDIFVYWFNASQGGAAVLEIIKIDGFGDVQPNVTQHGPVGY